MILELRFRIEHPRWNLSARAEYAEARDACMLRLVNDLAHPFEIWREMPGVWLVIDGTIVGSLAGVRLTDG